MIGSYISRRTAGIVWRHTNKWTKIRQICKGLSNNNDLLLIHLQFTPCQRFSEKKNSKSPGTTAHIFQSIQTFSYKMIQQLKMASKSCMSDIKIKIPVEVPFLVQTYPYRPKKAPIKSGAKVPLKGCRQHKWYSLMTEIL